MSNMEHISHRQAHNQTLLAVLVCYCRAGLTQQEEQYILSLAARLREVGLRVVVDVAGEGEQAPFVDSDLRGYQWVIVVQTLAALQSARIQAIVQSARRQAAFQNLQGVLRLLMPSARQEDAEKNWEDIPLVEVSEDYPRVLASILFTLRGQSTGPIFGITSGDAPTFVGARHNPPAQPLKRTFWLVLLIIPIIVLTIFGVTLYKTSSKTMYTPRTATIVPGSISIQPANMSELYTQIMGKAPTIDDALNMQDAHRWQMGTSQDQQGQCAFINGAYHVSITQKQSARAACLAATPTFRDLALQIDMQIIQGDVGGLVFRANGVNNYYWFSLDEQGCYELYRVVNAQMQAIIPNTCTQPVTMQGTRQLTIIARGSTLLLYIDGHFVQQSTDTILTNGQVGVVGIRRSHMTDVAFRNIKIWQL